MKNYSKLKKNAEESIKSAEKEINLVKTWNAQDDPDFSKVQNIFSEAKRLLNTNSYFGFLDTIETSNKAQKLSMNIWMKKFESLEKEYDKKISEFSSEINHAEREKANKLASNKFRKAKDNYNSAKINNPKQWSDYYDYDKTITIINNGIKLSKEAYEDSLRSRAKRKKLEKVGFYFSIFLLIVIFVCSIYYIIMSKKRAFFAKEEFPEKLLFLESFDNNKNGWNINRYFSSEIIDGKYSSYIRGELWPDHGTANIVSKQFDSYLYGTSQPICFFSYPSNSNKYDNCIIEVESNFRQGDLNCRYGIVFHYAENEFHWMGDNPLKE